MKKTILITTTLILLSVFSIIAQAQDITIDPNSLITEITNTPSNQVLSMGINYTFSPEQPGPFDTLTVTAHSYSIDLQNTNLTWFVNGEKINSGPANMSVTTTLGGIGDRTQITLVADGVQQPPLSITPATVDILWHAHTLTPPLYQGKALYSAQSLITFAAIPHVIQNKNKLLSKDIIYTWSQGNTVLGSRSGRGKDTLTLPISILPKGLSVTVNASSVDQSIHAEQTINLDPEPIDLEIYENSPLYGIWFNKTLPNTYDLSGKQVSFSAFPYNMNNSNNISYNWSMNSTPLSNQNTPTITLRNEADTSGGSLINLSVSQKENFLQNAKLFFNVHFQ